MKITTHVGKFERFLLCGFLLTNMSLAKASVFKTIDKDTSKAITSKAVTEIKYQAEAVVKIFELVLNSIAFNDNTPSELQEYIKNSFTHEQRNCVFLDNTIIIESDLDPKYTLEKNKDIPVEKYLNDFDLAYTKTSDFSVSFTNIISSSVKKSDHLYVRVRFDEIFKSKFKADSSSYPIREREALVKIIPEGKKKWKAYIESVTYFNPVLPIDSKDHNVKVIETNAPADDQEVQNALMYKNIIIPSLSDSTQTYTKIRVWDFQLKINNLKSGELKKINPVFFLKMKFDSEFGYKYSEDGRISQQIKEGEVLVRMMQNGKRIWNGYIEAITFDNTIKDKDKDIEYVSSDNSSTIKNIMVLNKLFERLVVPLKTEEKKMVN